MSYVVNVIYVRDTVEHLVPLLRSLVENTICRFRLVSNGCTADERSMLSAVSHEHPDRIQYVEGSRDEILSHGAMLERLLDLETDPFFVIADSDLLGVAPASFDDLLPEPTEGVRCSGLPVWHQEADVVARQGFRRLSGRYVKVAGRDMVVGCSYAAGYHTDRLRGIVERWQVPLGRVWWDELSEHAKAELDRAGMAFADYDTLKVVNIMHNLEGWPVRVVELPGIVHVGALTQRHREHQVPTTRWGKTKRRALHAMPSLATIRLRQQGLSWNEAWVTSRSRARRRATRRFVEQLAHGDARIDDAPRWLRDTDLVKALERVYASPPTMGHGS